MIMCENLYGNEKLPIECPEKFFKNYNSSYLAEVFAVLCFCVVSRHFYLSLVESFSSLSISLILAGTCHYVNQKNEYELEVPTNNT